MRFEQGWLILGELKGALLRFHWSIPLVALAMSRGEVQWAFWAALFALILAHELGHAAMVWRAKLRVTRVDVHGVGGVCAWSGRASPMDRALIAWGGVLAQLLVLSLVIGSETLIDWQATQTSYELRYAWVHSNLWIIGFNLLPVAPLDGHEAWRVLPLLRERFRARAATREAEEAEASPAPAVDLAELDRRTDEALARGEDAEVQAMLDEVLGGRARPAPGEEEP